MSDTEITEAIKRLRAEYQHSNGRAIHVSIDDLRLALDVITALQARLTK